MADGLVSEGAPTWSAFVSVHWRAGYTPGTEDCRVHALLPHCSLLSLCVAPIACTLCFATLLAYPAWYAWHLDLYCIEVFHIQIQRCL